MKMGRYFIGIILITELQGTLADYNIVMDKLHTGTEVADIETEFQALKATNDAEQAKLEQLFAERTQKQQQIHQLEEEIEKVTEIMVFKFCIQH